MFHLLFLPFFLGFWMLFGLMALSFILLRFAFRLVGAILMLPIAILFLVFGLLAGSAFFMFFLVPFLLVAACVWCALRLVVPRPI